MGVMGLPASRSAYAKQNLAWPLLWEGAGFRRVTLATRYEAALRHMLNTPQGSLYYEPDYGSTIYRIRTQGMQRERTGHIAAALAHLRSAAAKYIPDIQVVDLTAELNEDDQKLRISCVWIIREASLHMHGNLASQQTTTVLL
jgi:phage baseplate assembly protein W